MMPIHSQTIKNYESDWKLASANLEKGLPQTALKIVKKIWTQATADHQEAQVIKSLIYMNSLHQETRENNQIHSILAIENEIKKTKEPVTALLRNYLASLYQNYFNQYRYRLYGRTNTTQFIKTDLATWTTDDFIQRISTLYLESMGPKKVLQQASLAKYDALIHKGNMATLRPSLYDLVAHRALDYFKSSERSLTQPNYLFIIQDSAAFLPAAQFTAFRFTTQDSLSLQHKALETYQQLIQFHLKDTDPTALIDLDLERLQFVHQNAVMANKDDLFLRALENLIGQYPGRRSIDQAWFLIAQWHYQQANKEANQKNPKDTHLEQAKDILVKITTEDPKSEGAINGLNLLNQIRQPSLQIQLEKVNLPQHPFRMLVSYKNTPKLYIRILRASPALKDSVQQAERKSGYWSKLAKLVPAKAWEQPLPSSADHRNHRVEIKMEALPAGEYFIFCSANKDFGQTNNLLALQLTYISNISFANTGADFFVLHRNTGQPLAQALVTVWQKQYQSSTSKYINTKTGQYKTDKNGHFKLPPTHSATGSRYRNDNPFFEMSYQGDRLFMDDGNPYYYYNRFDEEGRMNAAEETDTSAIFFTDRSIYRPGQSIYFKGILLQLSNRNTKTKILPGYSTMVSLLDGNDQKIDSLLVTANEYGSFNGSFQLPEGGRNGQYQITTPNGSTSFRVEEYKRPKFFVEFEKLKGHFKINDSINLKGVAKAYAGNLIDGAKVKYRVVRQPRYPYPWLYARFWGGSRPQQSQEIAQGEAQTKADGSFTISFKALPDASIDPMMEPIFNYQVYADITDQNGEVRSGKESVEVGYKSLIIQASIPARIQVADTKSLSIQTQNMAGQFEKSAIHVTISRLKPEPRLLRDRFWEEPDQFVMTKTHYIENFPNDIYKNEDNPMNWETMDTPIQVSGISTTTGNFTINPLAPGYYRVEVSAKDSDGQLVKDVRYTEVFEDEKQPPASPKYMWSSSAKAIEPGEKTSILMGSSADSVFLIKKVDSTRKRLSYHTLHHPTQSFEFAATEDQRGGYGVGFMFIKNNRIFTEDQKIDIPWDNKKLNIEYESFRDKTQPGAEEHWRVKITGMKGEKVAAEMLGSMYDASLDQFNPHSWALPSIWESYYPRMSWNSFSNFQMVQGRIKNTASRPYKNFDKRYDQLFLGAPWPGIAMDAMEEVMVVAYGTQKKSSIIGATAMLEGAVAGISAQNKMTIRGATIADEIAPDKNPLCIVDGVEVPRHAIDAIPPDEISSLKVLKGAEALSIYGTRGADGAIIIITKKAAKALTKIVPRKNFSETAFFLPDLKTDAKGTIQFSFTMPEALTRWKFQAITHTKELAFGYSSRDLITQKDLMVQPNAPRFIREGDQLELSSKIVNLTSQEMSGVVSLQLFNAATNAPIDGILKNNSAQQPFKMGAGQSIAVSFPIEIPAQFTQPITWRIVAQTSSGTAATLSDGEENILPVLPNRVLVTESMPLQMRGFGTKKFSMDKLLSSGKSKTLSNQALTVEYSSNPAWYAIQALPYMMEYPYECAEQTWNRYYANSIATLIANSAPKVKAIFDNWKNQDSTALQSNLQKNPELKSILIAETPWVLQAQSESQQKKNIALLFDLVRMSNELTKAYNQLNEMQSPSGGFVWFKGGPEDRYMTQYIVTGIGHLKKIKGIQKDQITSLDQIAQKALPYLEAQIKKEYDELIQTKTSLSEYIPSHYVVQYLYMRSFFETQKPVAEIEKAIQFFKTQAAKTWVRTNKYMQGMTALALHRDGDAITPKAILKSLKESAIQHDDLGMYYKDSHISWWWYEAPIERQALLIEAFQEIEANTQTADALRTWLLKNKQTNHWGSTKSTAEACYALLLQGTEWLTMTPEVSIDLGDLTIESQLEKTEAGTGYMKKTIPGEKVKPSMGNISVRVAPAVGQATTSQLPSWGSVYWQYFENLDKITQAASPLQLEKKLFIETNGERGPVLTPIAPGGTVKLGDKIKVRVVLRVDRDMEYVHLRDMRASSFEPTNVLSSYKWQDGLGYYESTKDASTNFFFSYLRKGTYVFEYSVFATVAGNFSNGISTIQCMYAPEFSSHSEGIRVQVIK